MFLHVILPGLLWPAASTAPSLDVDALPSLMWLLGRSERSPRSPARGTQAFAGALGLHDVAPAVIRRAGEADGRTPAAGEHWLCADPVSLRFLRDQLVLGDPTELDLQADEMAALSTTLSEHLAATGDFELCAAERGYLRLSAPPDAQFSALDDVTGRPVALFLPEGHSELRWGRILNSVQIELNELGFNRQRDAAGRPQANSLWFWGEGVPAGIVPTFTGSVFSDCVPGRGAARLAGVTAEPLAALSTLKADHALVFDDGLHRAALFHDAAGWRSALEALEIRLFAPLASALKSGSIDRLTLDAPGDRHGSIFAIARKKWAFWLKPGTSETLIAH